MAQTQTQTLPHGTVDSATLVNKFIDTQQKKHADPSAFRGYDFPMKWFMDRTGGWGKGWMCYVYGKAGIGKSSVLTTAASRMGEAGVKFLYLSLEETNELVAQRMFSTLRDINRIKFRDIKLDPVKDWPKVYEAGQSMSKWKGYFAYGLYDAKHITDVLAVVKPDVFFVDYLQLTDFRAKSQQEAMSQASKFLLRCAKGTYTNGHIMTVISAAQLNDDGNVLYSRDPDRDADLTIAIEGIDNGAGGILPGQRQMTIRKFRHGEQDSTRIAFFGGRSLVGELLNGAHVGPIPPPSVGSPNF